MPEGLTVKSQISTVSVDSQGITLGFHVDAVTTDTKIVTPASITRVDARNKSTKI
jgi:hypothetical protein